MPDVRTSAERVRFLALVIVLALACSPSASNAPTPTAAATATPTTTLPPGPSPTTAPTATVPRTPTPTPISLPTTATISAPSGDVVWMLVGGSRLFRSLDRGVSWDERGIPAAARLGEIAFASERDGLILAAEPTATRCQTQQVSVWLTRDGAATWEQVAPRGIADSGCKSGASLVDAQHAFLGTWDEGSAPGVYSSVDGGRMWGVSRRLPDPPGFATPGAGIVLRPGKVRGFGSTLLLDEIAQRTSGGAEFAYRSIDGGAGWTYASTAPFPMPIAFVTATRWLQIQPPGDSRETTDGGATWHAYTTDYQQAAPVAPEIVFGDANVGYATVRGALQRTVDGGAHWTQLRTPGTF